MERRVSHPVLARSPFRGEGEAMKALSAALWLAAIIIPQALAEGRSKHSQKGLSVAIVPAKDKSGSSTINRDGVFEVVFTNRSAKPIRLWSECCQLGYETLSFRCEGGNGQSSLMSKRGRHSWDWKNTPPQTITIPARGTFSWKVNPSRIWGDFEWKGVPEPNTGKAIKFSAIFEIKSTDAANKHGVWTGRVISEPVEVLVVDPNLRTPHQYLEAGCPKQALRILQGDRTWVAKRDGYQRTPLHLAVANGFSDVVRWLLSHGADVNATAFNRFTPLHAASDPELVKVLLQYKANVNAKGATGTVLEDAARNYADFGQFPDDRSERNKWRTITMILLKAGADYDIRSACYLDDVGRVRVLVADRKQARDKDAMRIAARYGRAKIVKLLLERGADPEDADYGGLPVSYFAIEHANVLKLLFDAGANAKIVLEYQGNGPGPQGTTLLHYAAEKGIIESAKLLLSRGVKIDVQTPTGDSPLHYACRAGDTKMVEWLLKNNANARARAKGGWTPMSDAASEVHPAKEEDNARYQAVIRALERAGVKLDVFAAIACNDVGRVARILRANPRAAQSKDASGQPPLHRAVALDRKKIVKLLLDKGCDPDIRSKDEAPGHPGETALHRAAFWGRLEVAQMLIEHGAKINARAARGVTPLHEAARMGHLALAQLLLKHGANPNAKDDEGLTPLDWVNLWSKSPEIIKLLSSHGGHSGSRSRKAEGKSGGNASRSFRSSHDLPFPPTPQNITTAKGERSDRSSRKRCQEPFWGNLSQKGS
jgi:ankyrin repeat protein